MKHKTIDELILDRAEELFDLQIDCALTQSEIEDFLLNFVIEVLKLQKESIK